MFVKLRVRQLGIERYHIWIYLVYFIEIYFLSFIYEQSKLFFMEQKKILKLYSRTILLMHSIWKKNTKFGKYTVNRIPLSYISGFSF